jgi:hypothetical protein
VGREAIEIASVDSPFKKFGNKRMRGHCRKVGKKAKEPSLDQSKNPVMQT